MERRTASSCAAWPRELAACRAFSRALAAVCFAIIAWSLQLRRCSCAASVVVADGLPPQRGQLSSSPITNSCSSLLAPDSPPASPPLRFCIRAARRACDSRRFRRSSDSSLTSFLTSFSRRSATENCQNPNSRVHEALPQRILRW